MEDLAAAGRAADETIQAQEPAARRVTSIAEALRPQNAIPGGTPLPEHTGRPLLRLGEWNDLGGVA
jgi:hypothetical protein